jgi:hypothetical protein
LNGDRVNAPERTGSGPILVGAGVTYSESRFIANGRIPMDASGICYNAGLRTLNTSFPTFGRLITIKEVEVDRLTQVDILKIYK